MQFSLKDSLEFPTQLFLDYNVTKCLHCIVDSGRIVYAINASLSEVFSFFFCFQNNCGEKEEAKCADYFAVFCPFQFSKDAPFKTSLSPS